MAQLVIIKPKNRFRLADLAEIWQYRELLYFLTWRDIKARYKQTIVGIGWVIFQPLITMVIFSLFFGKLVGMPSENVPYPIFVYTGLLFWQFFATSVNDASTALINNMQIVTKVYCPRIILIMSSIMAHLIDFAAAAVILIGLMLWYGYLPSLFNLLMVPILVFFTFLIALGSGLFLASLNIKYRDIGKILPFFVQLFMYLTPVIYPPSIVGAKYSWILALNPMTGVIKTARSELLHTYATNWLQFGISAAACLVILVIGWLYFRHAERYTADYI